MISWLFVGKEKSALKLLAIDIGTASISAALVNCFEGGGNEKSSYEVVKILRYPFNLKDSQHTFLDKIKKLFGEVASSKFYPDKIVCSFSDPFYVEEKITKQFIRQEPEKEIDSTEFQMILSDIEQEAWSIQTQALVPVRRQIIFQSVNGYSLSSSFGYKGRVLDISVKFIFIPKYLKENIEEIKSVLFPGSEISFFSDAFILWRALKFAHSFEPAIVIDIGGEITNLFKMDLNEEIHIESLSFGIRTLERRIASFLKLRDYLEAESILRRYTSNSLEEAAEKKLATLIKTALEDWWKEFDKAVKNLDAKKGLVFLPKKIILSGGGSDFGVFSSLLKENLKKYYNMDVIIQNLSLDKFKEFFVSTASFSGGSDAVLFSLVLFNDF